MKPVRIGIIGLGGICRQRHVPGLRRIDGVQLQAVCNRSRESGEAAASEFGIPHIETDWKTLVERPDIDAVLIGTWPYLHRAISLAAFRAGKHVFCQARMAMNKIEAVEMYDAAQSSGLIAMLCPVPFGLSIDRTIARLLREDYLGQARLVRVQGFASAFADDTAPINWRKDAALSGLNIHTMGMYFEVIHRWFGPTKSVSAQTHTFVRQRPDATGTPVEVRIPDEVLANTITRGGVPVQYTFSTVVHHGVDRIEIYGSNATLRYDVLPDKLYGARRGEDFAQIPIRPEDAYDVANWRVEEDFIRAIRDPKFEYHPNFEDGLRYMQATQAVHDSAATGRTHELDT